MRISDWSSDVCSSDLRPETPRPRCSIVGIFAKGTATRDDIHPAAGHPRRRPARLGGDAVQPPGPAAQRSEEHTSELQSLMRISYAVFCLKKNLYNVCIDFRILRFRLLTVMPMM